MPKPANPTRVSLEGKTVFPVRCAVDLLVEVPASPSEFNGQITGLRRAEDKATSVLTRLFQEALNSRSLAERGLFSAPSLPTFDDEGQIRPDCRVWDKHWTEYQGRCFDAMLFMGNGDYSRRNSQVLLCRLADALSVLSELQQGVEGPLCEQWEKYVDDVARDVVMALTGKECVLVEDKPDGTA